MQNQVVVATSKEALNATGLTNTGKHEIMSVMGGDSELERAVGMDDTHHKLLKNDVVDFMFQEEDAN